ncbi:MAG TPA: hypothetical protein VFE88_01675 [Candidatus Nanoarchaeia archaeon]|nr:hypothetical protein [Candidatus Nanoarchaeia archaeon]
MKKIPKAVAWAYTGLFFAVVAAILVSVMIALSYKMFKLTGSVTDPSQALLMGNVFAVVGMILGVYALGRKGPKMVAIAALVLGFLVLALPYVLG